MEQGFQRHGHGIARVLVPLTLVMLVFRPSFTGMWWQPDVRPLIGTVSAGTSPFTKTITGITTLRNNAVAIAVWASVEANTWDSLSGTGWTKQGLAAQYRNTTGAQQSCTFAYKLMLTTGATGDVSQDQAALGEKADVVTYIMSFAEVDAPPSGGSGSYSFVQSAFAVPDVSVNPLEVTLAQAVGQGRGVRGWVLYEVQGNERITRIDDDQGHEYFVIQEIGLNNLTNNTVLFYCPDASGAQTIRVHFNQLTPFTAIGVIEHGGSTVLHRHSARYERSPDSFSPQTFTAGPVTTEVDNCSLLFAFIDTQGASANVSSWSGTLRINQEGFVMADGVSAAGTVECTVTVGAGHAGDHLAMVAAFAPVTPLTGVISRLPPRSALTRPPAATLRLRRRPDIYRARERCSVPTADGGGDQGKS